MGDCPPGLCHDEFLAYTLAGHIFRGAGVELAPGKFHFSAMAGQLQRAVGVDTVRNTVPAFERNGFGFKGGYRECGNFVEMSVFHGEDDAGSLITVSLKKVWTTPIEIGAAQNFFQCKPCLFAEVFNRSHAGKAVAKFITLYYNYNLSKFSAIYPSIKISFTRMNSILRNIS